MPGYVSFIKEGRTGNIIFQYLFSKIVGIKYNYTYVPIEEMENPEDVFTIHEGNVESIITYDTYDFMGKNIVCRGFFQKSEYYLPYRAQLIDILKTSEDYWRKDNDPPQYIKDFFQCKHRVELKPNDIVVSLRLDDFIQLPCPTSDIIPPEYYLDILDHEVSKQVMSGEFDAKIYIVCDKLRYDWEWRYVDFFKKWNPILIQEDIWHDCALMRDCNILLHSNSTLCWVMSFFSETKTQRYIPKTHFYSSQSLNQIEPTDILGSVSPLTHHEVYHVHPHTYLKSTIFPMSYCVPDEYIVNDDVLSKKHTLIAPLVPGDSSTYVFGHDQEAEYCQMYQNALFAHTRKKGGWDCLRHYEILGNGCIPIFHDLEHCPPTTLTTLPKDLILEANKKLLPWNYDNKPLYDEYWKKIMAHVRDNCSTRTTTAYFLNKLNIQPTNVLLIMGNCGVNYTRELFWIGMKRYIQEKGGVAVEYPKIDFMYDTFSKPDERLYGNGFTYARKLKDDYQFSLDEIVDKVKHKFFDMIIYGKVGPDEGHEGSIPSMPLWEHVNKRYTRNEITFLYGGDECIDMTHNNRYSQHIIHHAQFGRCFVREHKI
jgi:hypothetical protein